MKKVYIAVVLLAASLDGKLTLFAAAAEETISARIHAHIQVLDYVSACEEAKDGFERYPNSSLLFEAYVRALAKAGDEKSLWVIWNKYSPVFTESAAKREVLECVAWGIIESGSQSQSPVIKVMALVGAFFGQDARGVEIISKNMHDPSIAIRGTAVKLAGNMKDARLQDEILDLFHTEKNWAVRMEVIRAVGMMEIEEVQPQLLKVIADDHTTAEEKAVAIESLVNMLEHAQRKDVVDLALSERSGLRLLACEVIEALDLERDADLLLKLTKDHNSKVRLAAIKALGVLRITSVGNMPVLPQLQARLNDLDPKVAITAAWALMLIDPAAGQEAFRPWLKHQRDELRRYSAAALASTGRYGAPLMKEMFFGTSDPYVKMNLAFGLINQRLETEKACEVLHMQLQHAKERWMWEEEDGFKVLAPSTVKYDEAIPNYPESVNQLVQLDVLNILALMKYPETQKAVRRYLQKKTWGVTGMAAALLLTEGDEQALEIVEELLRDPLPKIRVQAALILALWGRGEGAITVLKDAYAHADRPTKEKILEGLGRIGAASIVPFLVDKLQEPYQSLRILAAAALIQCLYH